MSTIKTVYLILVLFLHVDIILKEFEQHSELHGKICCYFNMLKTTTKNAHCHIRMYMNPVHSAYYALVTYQLRAILSLKFELFTIK